MRRRGPRGPVRLALGFVSHVMIVSGVLLIGDAGVTLAWQEPISAYTADRQQAKLETKLADPPPRVLKKQPLRGDAIGKIELPALGRTYFIVEGTDTANLKKGPGHYPETPLPGERGTVAIAGHRTTNGAPFRTIDKLSAGDDLILSMADGRYVYRVEKTRIVRPSETSVKRRVAYNRLILSACHPLYSAKQRIVVFARQVRRGPPRVTNG